MTQAARQHLIRQILATHPVHSQDQLRDLLADHAVSVTQATLSRDLRALGVAKGPDGYTLPHPASHTPPPAPHHDHLRATIRANVVDAQTAASLVVLRTAPGHAQPVGLALDDDARATLTQVVGTVAGDDTIFIATPSNKDAAQLAQTIRDLAGLNQPSKRKRA